MAVITHLAVEKRQLGERHRERKREREMDVWRIEERIKRSAAIMMRRLTGRMVYIQFVGISVNTVLTHVLR